MHCNGTFAYQKAVVGQTFLGSLAANNLILSNSFGLHYGSASLNAVGSLTWGGYDQSRVLGDVGSYSLANGYQNNMLLSLLDVQIGMENGFLQLNSSKDQPANIIPHVPYMYIALCAAIAQNLPVVLSSYTNLYIWNTTDPQLERIINSPSNLAFVLGTSGVPNLTIKVPFELLNLTLDAAIALRRYSTFRTSPSTQETAATTISSAKPSYKQRFSV